MKYKIRNKSNRKTKDIIHSQDMIDINSIENNLDKIIFEKMDIILNQQKIENNIRNTKYLTSRKISNMKYNKLYNKKQEVINKRITLGQFLIKNNSQNDIQNIENKIKDKDKIKNDKKNQIENEKEKEKSKNRNRRGTLSFFERKELERKKNVEQFQKVLKNKNFQIMVNKSDHIIVQKKLGKRYTLFKTILNYLESNNITLYELLRNNPFQSKPYELSNSYDFLIAVKFKNYNYVAEALQYSKKYLFSFDYYGQTAYHWAAKLNDLKMLKLLIDYGLYHNQKDFKGRTPLYLAAFYNHKEICNYLLINNGNIFLKDKNGLSPADVADNQELKYYLYDYMAQPFSNPIYKARIQSFLKNREERIKKKKEKQFQEQKEKLEKERMKELLDEEKQNAIEIKNKKNNEN